MRAVALFAVTTLALSCGRSSVPPAGKAPATPSSAVASAPTFGAREIDAALREEWARVGITPAPRTDDGRWLRRVYIDVIGTIPAPEAVAAFVADSTPDKRAKTVDALLDSQAYAEHWKNYWDDELFGPSARTQDLDRSAFRRWLRARFAENASWDRIVTGLVTATGVNSAGGQRAGKASPVGNDDGPEEPNVNGAVNWIIRYEQTPQDLAGMASKTFLGVQIQCAQCHDHKTERWKQTDFWSFAATFARTRPRPLDDKQVGMQRRVDLEDLDRTAPRFQKNADLALLFTSKPKTLDGAMLAGGKDTRKALAAWMTAKDNPYFARAFVNRMWGHFLGRGFTDPVNDMRPSNPPNMDALLGKMGEDFAAHGYDIKRLVRAITATEAYALGPAAPSKADPENKSWARFRLTPMGPEELLNAILQATSLEGAMRQAGVANIDQLRAQIARQYTFLFDVDEDADAPSYEGTVSQALALLNGTLVGAGASAIPGTALDSIVSGPGTDAQKIEKLYLRAFARVPASDELEEWTKYITAAQVAAPGSAAASKPGDPLRRLGKRVAAASAGDPRRAAYEDVMWALMNSSEFIFNH